MKGLGTDDDRLCRVIVSRCEVDMVQIKEEFQKQYKQTLAMFIAVSIYISQQLTDNAVWMHFSLYLPLYCLYIAFTVLNMLTLICGFRMTSLGITRTYA